MKKITSQSQTIIHHKMKEQRCAFWRTRLTDTNPGTYVDPILYMKKEPKDKFLLS